MTHNTRQAVYFSLAVIVLGGSAIATELWSFTIIKGPLPIRKPLIDMSPASLGDYELVASQRLSTDLLSELGTEEYIEWTLRDRRVKEKDGNLVNLFVTYYTNVQDQVPHVPEECNPQAGLIPAGDDSLTFHMDSLDEDIDVRRLAFLPKKEEQLKNVVYYTINVNGTFHNGRQTARLKMADPRDARLYYSKLEIMFSGRLNAVDPELDRRAKELMDATIGVLFENYWPPRGSERGDENSSTSAPADSITK
ncbi:MAG: exosortase-associated EpsI family protein [Phycisphaerales bacterium]|nr:exosortase-associated EpsI family protein [Phycisphaerales bacterium]MCB9856676.1 exosortase-associated EpsI family protein [Phycisphaerales bacterium]MCB9862197.1 exosortase-associated EpsI family protein [Phycisphaerales bacterium]